MMQPLAQGEGVLYADPSVNRAREFFRHKPRALTDKVMSVKDAVSRFLADGDYLAVGGFGVARFPSAICHEIVRQNRGDLVAARRQQQQHDDHRRPRRLRRASGHRHRQRLAHRPVQLGADQGHRLVVDDVVATLGPVCRTLAVPAEASLTTLASVVHLATPVDGALREPLPSVLALARALHPTAAVAGKIGRAHV